jgi:hypothetical protein
VSTHYSDRPSGTPDTNILLFRNRSHRYDLPSIDENNYRDGPSRTHDINNFHFRNRIHCYDPASLDEKILSESKKLFFNAHLTVYRMMEETSEAEFERLLNQLRDATQEQPDPDGTADGAAGGEDEVLLDVDDDDDIVMLDIVQPEASNPPEATATPDTSEKVNENISDTVSEPGSVSNMKSKSGSDIASGYQASESDSVVTSMFNYSKYGTRSKIGKGETLLETEKPVMSSTYYQCKAARAATRNYPTVDVSIGPSAGVSEQSKHCSVGSLDCHGDTEILKTFRGSRITANVVTVNQNISATFDPANLKCVVCSTPHYVLAKGKEESPPTLIFADQNFVSTLAGGKSCLAIIRLEDASLPELAELAHEVLDRHKPPAVTLFLFGSASHLLNVGTTIYTQEWCSLVDRISTSYPDSRILPLAPVIREDCPGTVSRQLIELATWYKCVYGNSIMGITSVWDTLVSVLSKTDEDSLDLGYKEMYTVAMPAYLAPNSP